MLAFPVAVLAVASLAVAAPPSQSTYCYEDNLLRAFQHTPTSASAYCVSTTGYPAFLAVTSYPSTRLSSACSCFSRFPSETPTACVPPASPSSFSYSGTGTFGPVNILVTIGSTPCGSGGFLVTNVCGTLNGQHVSYSGISFDYADNCYFPANGGPDFLGLAFQTGATNWNIYTDTDGVHLTTSTVQGPMYPGAFQAACTGAACPS